MVASHPCPACGTPINPGTIACRDDWARLPSRFRHAITKAQHELRQARLSRDTAPEALAALDAARAQIVAKAVAWYTGHPNAGRT